MSADESALSSKERRDLFLRLVSTPFGATVTDVYKHALELGDTATEEAYYNIARRLAHRSLISAEPNTSPTRFRIAVDTAAEWMEEDELAEFLDPDYPLVGLAVWREAVQQLNSIPESVWSELRERLYNESAAELYVQAISSYLNDFHAEVAELLMRQHEDQDNAARHRKKADNSRRILSRITKYGLGLSDDAVALPDSIDIAIQEVREGKKSFFNSTLLIEEIRRRVEPGNFLVQFSEPSLAVVPIVGAVDGSTRGGVLSLAGADGDMNTIHAPYVNINTAIGQINRALRVGKREQNLFVRLPERPEDMQREDNRHTVMAKLLYNDLTDAEYMHAVWNAMDLIEIRTTERLLRRWYAPEGKLEVPPAEVVLRDGTVTPQERDFTHYKQADSYGQITRDIIEASWEVTARCREDGRTVSGVVKASQISLFGPIVNWYACRLAADATSQIQSWPLDSMNITSDQLLLTRLLTAGRARGDLWTRTCVILRPFHAVTKLRYQRSKKPADEIMARYKAALSGSSPEDDNQAFWGNFQGESDPYVKMLRHTQFGSFYLAAVPRLDGENTLPRFELLVPASTDDDGPMPWDAARSHLSRTLNAVQSVGWDVSAEHSMFRSELKLDVLPRLLIKAHDTVKIWAAELLGRVQEYVGYQLTKYTRTKRLKGVQVRPFTKAELEYLYSDLRRERENQAGAQRLKPSA